jgi:dephospho-CoA kinase
LRDSISRKDAEARIAAQWTDEARLPYADYVIENDGKKALIPQVLHILSEIE